MAEDPCNHSKAIELGRLIDFETNQTEIYVSKILNRKKGLLKMGETDVEKKKKRVEKVSELCC